MGSVSTANSRERVAGILGRFFGVLVRRQTYRNLVYLVLAFPLGLGYFVFGAVTVSLGLGLAIVLVGVVILAATIGVGLAVGAFERRLTNWLLDAQIEARTAPPDGTRREQVSAVLTHRPTWTTLVYLPSKFLLGVVAFTLIVTALSTTLSMLLVPLFYDAPGLYVGIVPDRAPEFHQSLYVGWNYLLVGVDAVVTVGSWRITTLPQALVVAALGVLGTIGVAHGVNALARVWRRVAAWMLGDGYDVVAIGLGRR
jgi:hypothetical protein